VARVLIVGCGCRGGELAAALLNAGHAVRGTTRRPERAEEIAALGAEAAVADPNLLGTIMPLLQGTSVVCWLAPGARLESLAAKLVDTHVRGFVCEAPHAELATRYRATYHMPAAAIEADPADHAAWTAAAVRAVGSVLS
jgi:uncharacterized protein YbjT (DUF2867 family)